MKQVFEKQLIHLVGLIILLLAAYNSSNWFGYEGYLWGQGTYFWFWLSIAIVVFHQFFAWFTWRTELHHGLMTKWLGKNAFNIYAAIFMILLLSRGLSPWLVGYSNRGTWDINQGFAWIVSLIILFPVIYLFYSIAKYFTFRRAMGIDHFDPAYRQKTLVREGIFKYTDNAMYTYGLAFVYLPSLIFLSKAALVAGLFSHAAVWLHYFTVERPDIKVIYKK